LIEHLHFCPGSCCVANRGKCCKEAHFESLPGGPFCSFSGVLVNLLLFLCCCFSSCHEEESK
jgi:hypothetical protein